MKKSIVSHNNIVANTSNQPKLQEIPRKAPTIQYNPNFFNAVKSWCFPSQYHNKQNKQNIEQQETV